MRTWTVLLFSMILLPGCSDVGTESDSDWIPYDLPSGHISLPPELAQSGATMPINPEFTGIVDQGTLKVQFCIYMRPSQSDFLSYEEETTTLHGRKVVLFRGVGLFHRYNSSFSTVMGAKAYFGSDNDPVVVLVGYYGPGAEKVARAILLTLRP
jgi:hypothetical protein